MFKSKILCALSLFGAAFFAGCGASTSNSAAKSVESSIAVKAIPNLSKSFIFGMDASSVLVEEKSGVTYYDFEGKEQDVFKTFADSGVNYIRLRVWNDPFDAEGHGYGGGNNDVATAIELGKRATKYGMKVQIDFHYSDFWADPKRQNAPKAWRNLNIDDKAAALADFTRESLDKIIGAGVNVCMVQVGNEINNGLAGETTAINKMKLLKAGTAAVRECAAAHKKDIKVALHYTNISDAAGIDRIGAILSNFKIDYDVFGLSYYAFWNGPMENMQNVVRNFREKYGKEVMLAETSYCYTAEDGDGFGNSVSGAGDTVAGYPATVQGQASLLRDVYAAAAEAGAIGVFYWEGAWIPVGKNKDENQKLWEEFGSGWASSYCAEYDPEDGALYYGGSSWDNQAFFDFDGHPLESLKVFTYMRTGSTAPLAVLEVPSVNVDCNLGSALKMPETVAVFYNDSSKNGEERVTWDASAIASVNTDTDGEYDITGTVAGASVTAHVKVLRLNLAKNGSFEESDRAMWTISHSGNKNPTDFQEKADDAHDGAVSLHFWSESDMDFSVAQELSGLENGTYRLTAFAQGGDVKTEQCDFALFAITSEGEKRAPFMLSGWCDWKAPVIADITVSDGTLKFGIRAKCNAKSWGTFDDFVLNRIGD